MSWSQRALVAARCLGAGALVALSIPPYGWWPLAFVGIAMWDRLLADQRALVRFRRSWLVAATWLFPTMLWMWDLTPPGYVIAGSAYAAYFGAACAAIPAGRGRRLALPGAIVLAELARWSFPFGGVPLATLAMSQATTPLLPAAHIGGALLLSGLVVVGGVALSAAWERQWQPALVATAVLVGTVGVAMALPRAEVIDEIDVAAVQGGGEQRTRARDTDAREVFERHLEASEQIALPVDLVLWPENVVSVDGELVDNVEHEELLELAARLDAPVIIGTTEGVSDENFRNASVVYSPDGTAEERYDKVQRVPFGEWVPFRPLVESLAGDAGLPRRDAVIGEEPAVVATQAGTMGLSISWEVFFSSRAADAIGNGGEVLLNPTNGSSYWLTQVQSQQVASSILRAVETDRWVVQAAPTGFSAVVTPDGEVLQRTGTEEQAVLESTVERRRGLTPAVRFGAAPVAFGALVAIVAAWQLSRRPRWEDDPAADPGPTRGTDGGSSGSDPAAGDRSGKRETTDGTTDISATEPPREGPIPTGG
ncbi:MAG: apolipoprotein N-acyltransferase [Acidimicrobiia bacterium]|nr:apolipoprotein N-acyltransferase [Acidimicrobiia bacterium]